MNAARVAKRLMPIDGDLGGLLDALGQQRSRRIHVLSHHFAGRATSGLWLPTKRADYLVIDEPTTPSRRAAIICHEVAHILLGHTPDITTSEVVATALPDLSPELIARALARHAYASDDETDAEELGTLIGAEHWSRRINSSRLR
ncbi:MAG TPA: ImmA/IrrE family metallo-endopeptidase [Microlunatus sp.]|nr:ImmA/IrrE family metallo-endopeptidase [Microlunatus sp.]